MAENQDEYADAKAKMRAALERKKETEHARADGRSNTGSIHGSEVTGAEGRRMFRRKSG
ncbi:MULTISPECIES: DUF5302 domain-containing protein [unclassified Pseudactinotalea]|uniref:DUF5302 domain-containing protein n=1 Tax=unclassified Pseudactinotalea TaxID=2649176 RepID=UPI001884018C|nr:MULTISPECIES: DUF5302 domain-containing protein [unclassified Pseudactinotalea]